MRRAIGIIRKSQGREGASPAQQRESIEAECKRKGFELVEVHEELEVKGATPLAKRVGLLAAIEAIESGRAEVVLAAYFDRLMRSLKVQAELVERVEAAGGEVLAVDVGQVTRKDASKKLSGNLLGAVAEYHADMARERCGDAQRRNVAAGKLPYPNVTAGYRKGAAGVLEPDPSEAPIVAEAFRLRADGASVNAVHKYLADNGIELVYSSVHKLLKSRVVLGEIHFGKLVNEHAHKPIVDRDVWAKVQRTTLSGGRRAVSDRLLARLGVLRCGTCGGKMIVCKGGHGKYAVYRCPTTQDCQRRVTISAETAESFVVERVRTLLADVEGRASAQENIRDAERQLEAARDALDAAVRAFDGLGDVEAARERLQELRGAVDVAQARVDQLGNGGEVLAINGARDWDKLAVEGKRALIRALIQSASVAPGRGAERITITTA